MATWGAYFSSYVKKKDAADMTAIEEATKVDTPAVIKVFLLL